MRKTVLALVMIGLTCCLQALEISWQSAQDMKGWTKTISGCEIENGAGLKIAIPRHVDVRGHLGVWKSFRLPEFAGKNIMVSFEAAGDNIQPDPGTNGGGLKVVAAYVDKNGKRHYAGGTFKHGTFDWERFRFLLPVPAGNPAFVLHLGSQNSTGTVWFRKLSIVVADTPVDIRPLTNMGFVDKVEKDGKGGWTDQGSDNDGAGFDFSAPVYAGVPFTVIDPAGNGGKAALVFGSLNFPAGLSGARLKTESEAEYLYLLHTAAWVPNAREVIGRVTVTGGSGKQTIDVMSGDDIGDQWQPKKLKNAYVAQSWPNRAGGNNGIYVSRFKLDSGLGKITGLELIPVNKNAVWIVAGITLSKNRYDFPAIKDFVVTAGERWKPLKRTASPEIVPGSALDFSYFDHRKIERVVVNDRGRLVRVDAPDQPFRFYAAQLGSSRNELYLHYFGKKIFMSTPFWPDKAGVEAQVRDARRRGYNMIRIHDFNSFMTVRDGVVSFDPAGLELWDYFVAKCKENGIYVQIDTMQDFGFAKDKKYQAKFNLLFSEKYRRDWKAGMKALLERRNPYTGTAMRDDPVLAVINYNNEQEFAFIRDGKEFDWSSALPEWRKFVGDPGAGMFTREEWQKKDAYGRRINDFIMMKWREMLQWYRDTLNKEIGYRGLCSLWEMTGTMNYNLLRNELDMVMMHAYHAHTLDYCTRQGQGSDIASALSQFRILVNSRIAGRPFCVNEFASVFWNKFRYEEAFAVGAYASFQGFDMLLRHGVPLHVKNAERMFCWVMYHDPVCQAVQVQNGLLYARGDVREGGRGVRLTLSEKAVRDNMIWNDGLNSSQSRLALITRFGLEIVDPRPGIRPSAASDDLRIPVIGGVKIVDNAEGFSKAVERKDSTFNLSKTIGELRAKGIISNKNRSRDWYTLESSTDELFVQTKKCYMTVDTPRFQGLCSLEGDEAKLHDVRIRNLRTNGNVSVASLDPALKIADSGHLLVIFATNALNTRQAFTDDSMTQLKYIGDNPTLVETGRFQVEIANANAEKLKVWPLAMNGSRLTPIKPVSNANGKIVLDIDTAKLPDGPALYFELAEK